MTGAYVVEGYSPVSMKQYYYQDDEGESRGPVTLGQLSAMMVEGVVNPMTLVVEVGGTHWAALGGVLSCGYILPPIPGRDLHHVCPRCKKEMELVNAGVPAHCPHCGFALSPESPGLWANFVFTLRKYASLRGRTTRGEYWLFQLVFVGLTVLLLYAGWNLLDASECFRLNVTEDMALLMGGYVCFLLVLALWVLMAVPQLSLMVRRLHDSGWSGWWVGLHGLSFVLMGLSFVYILLVMGFTWMDEMVQGDDPICVVTHEVFQPSDHFGSHTVYWMRSIHGVDRSMAVQRDIERVRPLYDFVTATKGVEIRKLRHTILEDDGSCYEYSALIPYDSRSPHGLYTSLVVFSGSASLWMLLTVLLIVLTLVDSQRGPNRYGPSVKYPRG